MCLEFPPGFHVFHDGVILFDYIFSDQSQCVITFSLLHHAWMDTILMGSIWANWGFLFLFLAQSRESLRRIYEVSFSSVLGGFQVVWMS